MTYGNLCLSSLEFTTHFKRSKINMNLYFKTELHKVVHIANKSTAAMRFTFLLAKECLFPLKLTSENETRKKKKNEHSEL